MGLQALYQILLSKTEAQVVIQQFDDMRDLSKIDRGYFCRLVCGVTERETHIDDQLTPLLDREVTQLDPIERVILRMGYFELTCCLNVPYRVVINEGVELAKRFGAQDSYRYINGVLDKLAINMRTVPEKKAVPER